MESDDEARAIAARLTDKMRSAVLSREPEHERTLHLWVSHSLLHRVCLILDGILTNDGHRVRAALMEREGRG